MWFWYAIAATCAWTVMNALDSLLVRSHEKDPCVLLFYHWILALPFLAGIVFWVDIRTSFAPLLFAAGTVAYVGDILFYRYVDYVDVSYTNIIWAFLALMLSIVGIAGFGETWTIQQALGASLIFAGTLIVPLWRTVQLPLRVVGAAMGLAFLFLPYWATQKYAIMHDTHLVATLFWMMSGQAFGALMTPLLFLRRRMFRLRATGSVLQILAVGVVLMFVAHYCILTAYALGPLSLISITTNVQPFLALLLSWFLWRFLPVLAPREDVQGHVLRRKASLFVLVFLGMVFLSS